jgi:hypothetical protein
MCCGVGDPALGSLCNNMRFEQQWEPGDNGLGWGEGGGVLAMPLPCGAPPGYTSMPMPAAL